MLLLAPADRVVDTDLRRVHVEHPPRHRPMKDLAERLSRFEPVAGRDVHPPGGDLLRGQLADLPIAEHGRRLAQEIAELLDRHRLHVMLREMNLHELGKRERARDPSLASKSLKLAVEGVACVQLGGEAAALHAL